MSDPDIQVGTTEAPVAPAPDVTVGQGTVAADTAPAPETTEQAPQTGSEDSFFDPTAIDPALQPAYKQMQAAFTRKMQGIKGHTEKVQAYDAFVSDPHGSLARMAQQYGYSIAGGPAGRQTEQPAPSGDWQPETWEDVLTKAKETTRAEVMAELQPLLHEVRNQKREGIERTLDETVPEWRQYEDQMGALLGTHPTLVNDPAMLAKLAIPEDVQKGRAMQAALRKMEAKAQSAQVTSGSQTNQDPTPDIAGKKLTFAESVDLARRQIAAGQAA